MEKTIQPLESAMNGSRTITLKKTGRTATIAPFYGKHVREAQRRADGDSEAIIYHIICTIVEIDGQPVHIEDLDMMHGADLLQLMGELGGNF